jgi:hypothetical protein
MGFKEELQVRLKQLGLKGWKVVEYFTPKLELKLAEEGDIEAADAFDIRADARIDVAEARQDGKLWQRCFAIAAHGDDLHGWNDQRAYSLFCQMIMGWELESFIQALPLAMAGSVLEVPASVRIDGAQAVEEQLSKPWFKPPVNDENKAWMTYIDEVLPSFIELCCWPDEDEAAFLSRAARVVHLHDIAIRVTSG